MGSRAVTKPSIVRGGAVIDGGHVWGREAVKGREESLSGDVYVSVLAFFDDTTNP